MQPRDDDVILVLPLGARRTGRLRLPPEVALWLHSQLAAALGKREQQPQAPKRRVRLRRGRWRS